MVNREVTATQPTQATGGLPGGKGVRGNEACRGAGAELNQSKGRTRTTQSLPTHSKNYIFYK